MPGSITPLPIMEEQPPVTQAATPQLLVVRFGYQRLIAELPYDGERPPASAQLVIRSHRGIELAQLLAGTCSNGGCGGCPRCVSRKQMLEYIEASGGKNFPFSAQGKVLRVATAEDLVEQRRLDARKPQMLKTTEQAVRELNLPMNLVDVESLLGGERIIFYYTSEAWVDFRELVRRLAAEYQTRIEMHQVNARDEARIVADYERCGQHCCCRQFLKVLKPVSMRSAKVQKATLDPTKISGRCGRLMCCLRYEDELYETLRKKLPHKQTRVMTSDGIGTVIETQILTQLVLVRMDQSQTNVAFAVETIRPLTKEEAAANQPPKPQENVRAERPRRTPAITPGKQPAKPTQEPDGVDEEVEGEEMETAAESEATESGKEKGVEAHGGSAPAASGAEGSGVKKRRRRRGRRRRGKGSGGPGGDSGGASGGGGGGGGAPTN